MTPDAAVTAAWHALRGGHTDSLDEATRAVDAVRPIIRAQAFADAAAVLARTRDQWIATRATDDWSPRIEYAYAEAARVLAAWAEDPTVIDGALAKIAAETEKS